MAQKIVKTRLVHRKDLSTKWSSVNPILLDGEMGIEKDTRKFKIGDGVTSWNDLPYANVTYDNFLAKFSVNNNENTPGTAPIKDDNNQISINTLDSGGDTVAVNKGYMKKHVEQEINKISQGGKVATLGEDGKIPASQLPSYVDDIIEGYYFSQNNFFKAETFIHTPFSIGPLKTIYFNTQKYNDDNYFNYLEDTFPSGYGSYEDVLKFSSGYILRVYPGSNDVRLVAPDKTYIEILNGNNFVSYYNLPDDIGDVVEILSSTLVNNKSFQDMIGPVNFEYELAHDKNKIYLDTLENKVYRMSSSGYYVVEISSSLALGETSSTAYAGNKGKQNADNIAALQAQVAGLQPKEDSTLQTTSKTVPGAINELKQNQNTNSTNIQTNVNNITKLQQDLTAANTSIASNFNRITDLEGVADEVFIELEEINEKIAQSGGSGGGGTVTVEDSFVTVNELPETTVKLPGTPTPVGESVYIENLYFNTNLSVEEVKQIILNYCEENNLYDEYGTASIGYIGGSDNTKQISITVSTTTGIYIGDNAYPSFTYYWCDEQFANSNMGNYNITRIGWQDFENPLVIDENVNAPCKPMELFSITPSGEGLNPNIKEEKIYRLFHKEEPRWVGTPIPNTGKADGFYFNISLSIEEVEKIINTLDFSNGASDHEYQVMWFNTGMTSDDIKIEKYEDGAMRITSASSGGTYWCNQKYKDNYNTSNSIQNIGWGAGSSSWNDEGYVRLSYDFYSTMDGKPVGDQNDKLSELISLTPFEYVEGKEKLDGYYRFKNNKWIKVLEDTLVVDVDKLPEGGWNGTAVPNTGLVGKVYVNTSLSDEEVETFIDKLCPINEGRVDMFYNLFQRDDDEICCGIYLCAEYCHDDDGNVIGTGKYVIAYFEHYDEGWITDFSNILWCNSIVAPDYDTTPGWQNFINPIEINTEVQDDHDASIYNDQLISLFSTTPFTKLSGGELDKIYRVPTKNFKGWNGTLPQAGDVLDKIYFNTELSIEEVSSILNKVLDGVGEDWSPLLEIKNSNKVTASFWIVRDKEKAFLGLIDTLRGNNAIWANKEGTSTDDLGETVSWTAGWQESIIPYPVDNEVLQWYNTEYIDANDFSKLISTTPFTKNEETTGYTYHRQKDGKFIQVLDEPLVVDVEELPSATIDTSTAVPSSGLVGKVHFNTKLSVEEVNAILDTLEYTTNTELYPIPFIAVAMDSTMQNGLMCVREVNDDVYNYAITVVVNGEGNIAYTYDTTTGETKGWLLSEYEINIDNMLSALAPQVGMTIQNSALKQLISITPFEAFNTNIQLDKLYRVPILGGVPTSGYVDKVYFNTSLSVEETAAILETLEYKDVFGNGQLLVPILSNADMSTALFIRKLAEGLYVIAYLVTDTDGSVESLPLFSSYAEIGYGWLASEFEFNDENAAEVLAKQIGISLQNDQVVNVINTSKTFSSIIGYKYHQYVNGEWKELGSGGSGNDFTIDTETATDSDNLITSRAVRNYVAEYVSDYMSTNYGNGDTEEF